MCLFAIVFVCTADAVRVDNNDDSNQKSVRFCWDRRDRIGTKPDQVEKLSSEKFSVHKTCVFLYRASHGVIVFTEF